RAWNWIRLGERGVPPRYRSTDRAQRWASLGMRDGPGALGLARQGEGSSRVSALQRFASCGPFNYLNCLMLAFLRVIFIKDHGREPGTGETLPSHPLKGVLSFADAFAIPIAMMRSMGFDPVLISAIREGV